MRSSPRKTHERSTLDRVVLACVVIFPALSLIALLTFQFSRQDSSLDARKLLSPFVKIRGGPEHKIGKSIGDLRHLSLALFEFESEYGDYPSLETARRFQAKAGENNPLDTSTSNAFFRQLIASGILSDEELFQTPSSARPDNQMGPSRLLEKGECVIVCLFPSPLTKNSPPILITPAFPGTRHLNSTPFNGKALLLNPIDNSVISLAIDSNGHPILDGQNLFDPTHPFWKGNPSKILWPE